MITIHICGKEGSLKILPKMSVIIALAVVFLLGQPASAQGAAAGNDQENQGRLICAGMGFQNGYLDGYEIGQNDRQYRAKTDITAHPLYQKADRGYSEKWVYLVVYQNAYRRGMADGYEDGYGDRPNLVVNRFNQLEDAIRQANLPPEQTRRERPTGPVILPAGTRVLMQLNDLLSTKMNQRGDPFSATVVRDVFVGNELAIPEGTIIRGTVGQVTRPGRIKGRAEMNLRFDRIVFKDGNEMALSATLTGIGEDAGRVADREGTYEGKGSEGRDAKIIAAGAGTGTVIGAIAGGGKGGLIGATIGGLVGLAGVLSTRGEDIELVKGTLMEVMLDRDLKVDPGDVRNR